MMNILVMISWILMGWACAYHAKRRARNPALWFGIGLLFGIFGLILLLLLPAPGTSKKSPFSAPRMGRPSFFKKETAPKPTSYGGVPFLAPLAPEFESLAKEHRMWYYLDENKTQFGPMSIHLLHSAWQEGKVTRSTYVWNEDFEEWKVLDDLLVTHKSS